MQKISIFNLIKIRKQRHVFFQCKGSKISQQVSLNQTNREMLSKGLKARINLSKLHLWKCFETNVSVLHFTSPKSNIKKHLKIKHVNWSSWFFRRTKILLAYPIFQVLSFLRRVGGISSQPQHSARFPLAFWWSWRFSCELYIYQGELVNMFSMDLTGYCKQVVGSI